jgi:hypothetical protein
MIEKGYPYCSRCCNSKLNKDDFDTNLKTNEYYKSCKKCREWDQNKNKDQIKARKKEYYRKMHDRVVERVKQWQENNQGRLKEIIECECGGKYQRRQKCQHVKTAKHLEYNSCKSIRSITLRSNLLKDCVINFD